MEMNESKTNITEAWSKGDDYPGTDQGELPIAGIHIGQHGNAVECYSIKAEDAAAMRDHILACVARCAQIDKSVAMIRNIAGNSLSEDLAKIGFGKDDRHATIVSNHQRIVENSVITCHPGAPYVSIDSPDSKGTK
jgi:hypothetical protein